MLEGIKRPLRWILLLALLEAGLGATLYLLGDATTGPKFIFLLLVIIVNLPGYIVAAKLGLLGQSLGSGGDPVLAGAVIFGLSLLFYSGCIWAVHRAFAGNKSDVNPWKIGK